MATTAVALEGRKPRRVLPGFGLTLGYTMLYLSLLVLIPISAVSGYYFAHPQAEYFGVARIGRDQLEDYARRRGLPIEQAERYLRPNLGY